MKLETELESYSGDQDVRSYCVGYSEGQGFWQLAEAHTMTKRDQLRRHTCKRYPYEF